MAADYQELIKLEMFDKEWVPQESLLSTIARKKHGISKAGDKKKGAVLIALKSMYRKGVLKKEVDEDGNVFWGKRSPGDAPIILREKVNVEVDPFELMRLITARKNIALLEDALRSVCAETLEKIHGGEWEKCVSPETLEILKKYYFQAKKSSWRGGRASDLLASAGIKDVSYIFSHDDNWEIFKERLGNKFIFLGKLTELGEYRNKIQHNEPLSKEEYLYFNIATQLLLQKLAEQR